MYDTRYSYDFFHDVTSLNMMIRKFCYQAVVVVVAVAVAGKAKKKEENQVNKYSFTYRYQCHPQGHRPPIKTAGENKPWTSSGIK